MIATATNESPARSAATVLHVQRMSTEDGPGIRTTVFLKGCSLACRWCQNPESMAFKPQLVWHGWRCIDCDECDRCPEDALVHADGRVEIRENCTVCTWCADACPASALEVLGRARSVPEVFAEISKDRAYYDASGGGVTVSGGEPALWPKFVEALLGRCREAGIHTAVDTSGMCSPRALRTSIRHADLVLYDVKDIDPERHRRFTGRTNFALLRNLLELGEMIRARSANLELWIRTPLIPGATATRENVDGIGRFLAEHLADVVKRWELCAFNNLARDKYRRLGMPWDFATTELLGREELAAFEECARGSGIAPEIVVATGPTRAMEVAPAARCDAMATASSRVRSEWCTP